MPAGEAIIETWKRLMAFLMLGVIIIAVAVSFWSYFSYSKKAIEIRDVRIQLQSALARWSGTGNASGVVRLDLVDASALEPCTTARVYYANGTLAKQVSTACP